LVGLTNRKTVLQWQTAHTHNALSARTWWESHHYQLPR